MKWCRGGLPPDGKTTTIARLRGISLFYYDLWNECSDIEIRRNGEIRAYDIGSVCTYPRKRFILELKHNGFNGNYYNLLPYDFLKAILSDSRTETMLKAGQYPMLHHYIRNSFDIGQYWCVVFATATLSDGSMWRDTIDLLRHFGKDINSPKYVFPADLKAEHDRLVEKKRIQRELNS